MEEETNQRLELLKNIKLENLEEELKKKSSLEHQKVQATQPSVQTENQTQNSSVEPAKSSSWNIRLRLASYLSYFYKKQNWFANPFTDWTNKNGRKHRRIQRKLQVNKRKKDENRADFPLSLSHT